MKKHDHNVLRLPQTEKKAGLKKSSIYRMIQLGLFPKPISLGERAVGWLEADVDKWIEEKISSSKKT